MKFFRAAAARFWGHEKAWDLSTPEGKAQAAVKTMDRTLVKDMRKEFYELRGWDPETGRQKAKTLERLGLSEVLTELKQMEMIF